MGKSFEHTYYHYSGTDCVESNFRYAERYFYEYVSEETVDGITTVTVKTTGISVSVVSNSYNNKVLSECTLTDNEFYDVMDLTSCKNNNEDVFAYMRQQVESGDEAYLDFEIGSSSDELTINGIEITSRQSDDGCTGITFTVNILIIVAVIVIILVTIVIFIISLICIRVFIFCFIILFFFFFFIC